MSDGTNLCSFPDLKDKQKSPNVPTASARQLIAMELLQTEKNYVGIINTILKVPPSS